MVVEGIADELLAYDAILAVRGSEVPAAGLLGHAWSARPLAAVTVGVPRPVPTWDEFEQAYDHLLSRRKPLTWEQWGAAAGFAGEVGRSDPVAGILLGLLVAAGWQDSEEGNQQAMLRDDVDAWQKVFLPLARNLLRGKAVWAVRWLSKLAVDSLTGVGRQAEDDLQRVRVLRDFRQIQAAATATINEAAKELRVRLVDGAASPDVRLDLAALCWLLGDAPRADILSSPDGKLTLDCAEFVVRRCLAEVRADPFLEAGWQRLAELGVLDTSPELAPIYYRLTRTSNRQMLELDRAVPAGPAGLTSRFVYSNLKAWLSGRRAEIELDSLRHLLDAAKDIQWQDFRAGYLRLAAMLLLASGPASPADEEHEAQRWEWEKLAHGSCAALWANTVNNVAATSADLSADLPFYFLPSRSPQELSGALELVEAYRAASLEYALTVTPPAPPDATPADRTRADELRSELRGLRFLQAKKRLPAHMRRYYAPPEDIAPGGPLAPERLFDAEQNRTRQREVRQELERVGADLFAEPRGCGRMRPGSGRVLIDFRRSLAYPQRSGGGADEIPDDGDEAGRKVGQPDTDFGQRVSRAKSLREAGDLESARTELEGAIALAETAYGRDDTRVAETSNVLGNVLQDLGQAGAAQQCYARALAIHEASAGLFDGSVATDRHNLGTAAYALGALSSARAQVERAIGIDTAVYGPDTAAVATDRMTLGEVLTASSEFDRAVQQYRLALEIRTKVCGPGHPAVAKASAALAAAEARASVLNAARPEPREGETMTEAMFQMGVQLQDSDPALARSWYEKAAAGGHVKAMNNLGALLAGSDRDQARTWLEKGARAGNIEAMANLGALLVEADPGQARPWLEKAAQAGSTVAMTNLGVMLADSDPGQARPWLEKAAQAGSTVAMFNLGAQLKDRHPDQARRWFEKSAQAGDMRAMFALGILLEESRPAQSRRWYEQAAQRGHDGAMVSLGVQLKDSDPDQARHWLEKGAEAGNTLGMYGLALMLKDSQPAQARRWLEQAARAGSTLAMNDLGIMLADTDLAQARRWWEEAAGAGSALAMNNLGGLVADSDPDRARRLFEKAAQSGDADAMFNLSLLLRTSDPGQARRWLEQAARAGNTDAMNNLGATVAATDPAEARRWWEEAAKAGNARAMSNLATLLKDSDPRKARYWGEKAKSTLLS